MRRRHLVICGAVATAAVLGTAAAKDFSATDLAAQQALTTAFSGAVSASDWAGVAAMYAEDAVLMPPNMPAVKGRAAIQEFFEGHPAVKDFRLQNVVVRGGADVVTVMGAWSMNIVTEGGLVPDSGHYMDTRERQKDGSWLIVLDMFNSEHPLHDHE